MDNVFEVTTQTDLSVEDQMIAAMHDELASRVRERDEWIMRFCRLAIKINDQPSAIVLRESLSAAEIAALKRYWPAQAGDVRLFVMPSRDEITG